MSRIKDKLVAAKPQGGGFIPFVSAGDPDLETSLAIIRKLADLGADVIEFGVPFSDPMADGPVIQRSSQRGIDSGATLQSVLNLATAFRQTHETPLVLFSYFNPIVSYGIDNFVSAAAHSGVDGLLLTDVIEDEAAAISDKLAARDIDLISLIAPTTTDQRLETICDRAKGFIYAVSRAGVTGAQRSTSHQAEELVARARRYTGLPIAVGFGISTGDQVRDVWRYADAAVVGSAIVAEIERSVSPADALKRVGDLVSDLLGQFAKTGAEN